MKKWRKWIAVLCTMMLLVLVSGCGKSMKDSPYLGKWVATTGEYSGLSVAIETVFGGEFTFTLKDNGKCVLSIAGEEEKGCWDETETGFIIEDEFEMVVDGDVGTMDYDGVTINFEKE